MLGHFHHLNNTQPGYYSLCEGRPTTGPTLETTYQNKRQDVVKKTSVGPNLLGVLHIHVQSHFYRFMIWA